MGIWTGIKHALNSTLGTSGFKPLNEIIMGQKQFVASDNLFFDIGSAEFRVTAYRVSTQYSKTTDIAKIKFNGNGSVKFFMQITSDYGTGATIELYKGDILVSALGSAGWPGSSEQVSEDTDTVVSIEKGVEYTLKATATVRTSAMAGNSYTATSNAKMQIKADIVDLSLIEVSGV